jgi:hypothetical protein
MRWIAFQETFELHVGDLRPIAEYADQPMNIIFSNGYWIAPMPGESLRINGIGFTSTVPLPLNATVELNGLVMRTERPGGAKSSAVEHRS